MLWGSRHHPTDPLWKSFSPIHLDPFGMNPGGGCLKLVYYYPLGCNCSINIVTFTLKRWYKALVESYNHCIKKCHLAHVLLLREKNRWNDAVVLANGRSFASWTFRCYCRISDQICLVSQIGVCPMPTKPKVLILLIQTHEALESLATF